MTSPEEIDYLNCEQTAKSWLTTLDHKRIGLLYFWTISVWLLAGGVFALLIRIELLTPGPTIMEAMTYNRMFTIHGVVMVWMFLIPSIPNVFGNFMLPIMIGAKEVAFPRINILSWWVFLVGSLILVGSILWGAIDTGWTFYPPYSSRAPSTVVPAVFGVFVIGASTIMTATNFIVTVHTMRAKGLTWMKLPLFVWAIYGVSIIMLLATPVLALVLILVGLDHWFEWGTFDASRGGDPVLFQHLFWFYSHPAVYIMVLPGMGVISEVVATFAHRNPPYLPIVVSTFGIAFVGFLTWGHHMFVAGMSPFDAGAFGILSMVVAIFSAIKVFSWTSTFRRGSVVVATPLIFVFEYLFLFVFGGMTGVAFATVGLNVHWHDTYFIVAHFHFIMAGGTLVAYFAACHYWLPKVTGRMYSERWGYAGAAAIFAGFFFTFFPQFLLGNMGMPRRYFEYPDRYQGLNVVSTVGSWVLATGMITTAVNLLHGAFYGKRAGANPWDSRSFEWRVPSPPPKHNFRKEVFDARVGAYDYHLPLEEHEP